MRDFGKPLMAAVRSLARQPAVTLPAVLVLALGIGATTALFSYLAALVWPRLEAPEPERIVEIYSGTDEEPRLATSYLDYLDFDRELEAVGSLTVPGSPPSPPRQKKWLTTATGSAPGRSSAGWSSRPSAGRAGSGRGGFRALPPAP